MISFSKKQLDIVVMAAEVAPLFKAGGLADVVGFLPKALKILGQKVRVCAPLYESIVTPFAAGLKQRDELQVFVGSKNIPVTVWEGVIAGGVPAYFFSNKQFFSRKNTIYGSSRENARFRLFNTAVLTWLRRFERAPDILHCNDWHTGLVPFLLKREPSFAGDKFWKNTAVLYTIHNLAFQFGKNWWGVPSQRRDRGLSKLPPFDAPEMEEINFAKRAILFADVVNAVSEQYAREILTKEFGENLEKVLRKRKKDLYGIINGIDEAEYNPSTDPGLVANYDVNSLEKKVLNKLAVQRTYGLPERNDVPLIAVVSRLTEQKGLWLLLEILNDLLKLDVQLIVMGGGERHFKTAFKKARRKYPQKFTAHLQFDTSRATMIYAASDMFLMPSRFEPCGLGQLISLRYGSVPVVRATGGLIDTVRAFDPKTRKGNGFFFYKYKPSALLAVIERAVDVYKDRSTWNAIIKSGMKCSFSWETAAEKYLTLYRQAIKKRKASRRY